MKVLMTGSTGLVGSAAVVALKDAGHTVTRLVRDARLAGGDAVLWDSAAGALTPASLEGHDAVVHLAGESIAARRWSSAQKARIRNSRVQGTRALCDLLGRLKKAPQTFVAASAIGYYGDRGTEVLTEDSPAGPGFLPDVCQAWEAASAGAAGMGMRVAYLRFGIILSRNGGALARMLFPFQMGAGGILGDGRQYMSWITLDDTVSAIRHALETESLKGPANVVAPHPVTNREFTRTLGRVLHRPTLFPAPAFALRVALGELADALLLSSARVEPARLLAAGFRFQYAELEPALRHVLKNITA